MVSTSPHASTAFTTLQLLLVIVLQRISSARSRKRDLIDYSVMICVMLTTGRKSVVDWQDLNTNIEDAKDEICKFTARTKMSDVKDVPE